MKRIIFVAICLISFTYARAQQAVGTPDEIKRFLNTTTYVVLENNPLLAYNTIIKETVEKHWNLTPIKFVTFSTDEFDKARLDPQKSFLIVNKIFFDKDKTKAKYNYLCVQLGGDYSTANQMPDIANIPISYDGVEEETYSYKLGMLCQFLQNHIKITSEHPELKSKTILKYYYKNASGDLKNKTLYVTKADLAKGFGMKQIKAVYPYDVKLVTREDVEKAINEHNEKVVFVHKIGPESSRRRARCFKTIVGASDAQIYYFGWHMISDKNPEGLLAKDWKKLANMK